MKTDDACILLCAASRKRWRDPWRHIAAARPPIKSTATACTARTRRQGARRPCRRRPTSPGNPTCRVRITRTGRRIPPRACRSIRTTRRATLSRRATAPWYRASVGSRSPLDISRITLRRDRFVTATCSSDVGCRLRKCCNFKRPRSVYYTTATNRRK